MRARLPIILFIFSASVLIHPGDGNKPNKVTDDDIQVYECRKYRNNCYKLRNVWKWFCILAQQPSCEYPLGSGIEHIFDGSLWVGGFVSK